MLSLIEVTCPHCQAKGQIMLPPLGALIVGSCPECQGMVTIFCGRVLPLDGDIMREGSPEDRHEHLMEVLGVFLDERVRKLFEESDGEHGGSAMLPASLDPDSIPEAIEASLISESEMETFKNAELTKLDDTEYFNTIFR